jgi:AcrR family transcriptional regulator
LVNVGVYTLPRKGVPMSCQPGCATCQELREAALATVGEGGTEALSEHGLAERVGLPPGEFERHYRTAGECLYATYDEIACGVMRDMVDAFTEGEDWQSGFEFARRRLLERMAAHPAEARLCFVETVRGDRELRRRRDITRRWIVEFLTDEYALRRHEEGLPPLQIELLIGAGFQTISTAVAEGDAEDLVELEGKLAEIAGFFIPQRV